MSRNKLLKKADEYVNNLSIGLGRGFSNRLEGILSMIESPVQTAKGFAALASNPSQIPGMVRNALSDAVTRGTSGPMGFGEVIGENIGPSMFRRAPVMRDIFAGPNAKTADLDALQRAKTLLSSGADDAQVWRETGWWVNTPDGVPRFEIDDSRSLFNTSVVNGQKTQNDLVLGGPIEYGPTVGGILEHPELQAAYGRSLAGRTVVSNDTSAFGSGLKGSFDPSTRTIQITAPAAANDARSTTLHELTHAVQSREGMARGGSPSDPALAAIPNPQRVRLEADPDFVRLQQLQTSPDYSRAISESNRLWADEYQPLIAELSKATNERGARTRGAEIVALHDKFKAVSLQQFPILAETEQLGASLHSRGLMAHGTPKNLEPYEAYRRLAGEAEARAVQQRMNLTPKARRMIYPWESYDVPLNELIIRRD